MNQPTEPKRVSRLGERRANRPDRIDPDQLYSLWPEYCAARDISRAGAYLEIQAGEITVVKEGARTKIRGAEIIRRIREIAGDEASAS